MAKRRPAERQTGLTIIQKGAGAPDLYRYEYSNQVKEIFQFNPNTTDAYLAKFFEVSLASVSNWRKTNPEFLESIKQGRETVDLIVVNQLLKRAMGYEAITWKETKDGTFKEQTHFPPDTRAIDLWLRNRKAEFWGNRQEVNLKNNGGSFQPNVSNFKVFRAGDIVPDQQNEPDGNE